MKKGSHHTTETRAKMVSSHKGFRGRRHTEEAKAKLSAAYKRTFASKEIRAEISNRMRGNKNGLGHHLSEEVKAKIGAANRVNSSGKHQSQETRAKKSALMTGEKNPFYGKHHSEESLRKWFLANQIKPNKQELKLQSILDEHFPNEWKFVGDGQLIIGGLCPDFTSVDGKKVLLELYGDWWHNKTERWNYTELGRIMAFNGFGFKCLVVWEHELKNEGNVVSKVEQFMKQGKR